MKMQARLRQHASKFCFSLCIVAPVVGWLPTALAQSYVAQPSSVEVPLNKSKVLQFDRAIVKVSVGNPNVADIVVLRGAQLYVLGKKLGTTNVMMWDRNNQLIEAIDIAVQYDMNSLKQKLAQLLPEERIEVHSSQGAIVLNGQVSSLSNMSSAMDLARSFVRTAREEQESSASPDKESKAGGKGGDEGDDEIDNYIVNLMSIGGSQQVMLKVTVAELSRSTAKKLGVKFHAINHSGNWTTGGVNGGATFPDAVNEDGNRMPVFGQVPIIGPMVREFLPSDLGIDDKGLFASYLGEDFLFSMALEAAKENGTAKILAEPTLTALSGQDASFLSGGEFPIPVPNGRDQGTTIEFKEFGVGVKFMPVVLSSGAINLKLNVSVTQLSNDNSVVLNDERASTQFFVPSLSSRSSSTTIELADGQTIGIAGLINENMRSVVSKFPGLGDIPILGQLFRSQSFEKGESELVIMVTPYLAQPINNELTSLPTDSFVEPSDWRFYLLGKTYKANPARASSAGGSRQTASIDPDFGLAAARGQSGGVDARFGHTIE